MDDKNFKKLFSEIAKSNKFEYSYGGWFKNSVESIVVLNLQKSNFGNYYEMNIKIFIQGIFGINYCNNKDLVNKDVGDIFIRQLPEHRSIFDLDCDMKDESRRLKIEEMFNEFVVPFTKKALSKVGIIEMANRQEVILLPAIKVELGLI